MVPGRDDVYIIPRSTCTKGTVLNRSDTARYYTNSNIVACFVLKTPGTDHPLPMDGSRRFALQFDEHRSMVSIAALAASTRLSDTVDKAHGFPPHVVQCTAALAELPTTDFLTLQSEAVGLHRMMERDSDGKELWLEDVARFNPAEMAASLEAINAQLLHAYTIAHAFVSRDQADKACSEGGLVATKRDGIFSLTMSLRSPAELGWHKNAGGHFRQNVAMLMGMAPADVQAVIICAIPNHAIEAAESDKFTIAEHADDLKYLIPVQNGNAMYSTCR